jgi:hypothetical protein
MINLSYFDKTDTNGKIFRVFYGNCILTKKNYSVSVPIDELRDYMLNNKLIQEALISVSDEDREFLISGVSPEGWKQLNEED